MESTAGCLASYISSLKYEDIPPEVLHKVKGLLIDTLGCGIGGYPSEPARIARRIADRIHRCDMPATIFGSGQKSLPELATFANGVMIRYLDFNDSFVSKGGGHPSDNFAPILTCADAVRGGGKAVIVAAVLAYEVFGRLFDQYNITPKGFDQAVTGIISCVAGASKILGLSQDQTFQAINIAVVANLSMQQARVGELSMWKGCAMPNAGRNAVFAALLAKEGLTGPNAVFEGRYGFFKVVTGPFQLLEFGGNGKPFRIMDVSIKRYPCGQFSQTAVDAAIRLRSRISGVDDIAEINIGTFNYGKIVMGGDAEKWRPRTRESADHSLPWVVGAALMYGVVEAEHFSETYLNNPDLLGLIQKINVEETEECNNLYPGASANRVELVTKSGKRLSELVRYHRGHHRNPMTDEEIEQKFHSLTRNLMPSSKRHELLSTLWNIEQVDDVGKIMELLIIEP